MAAANILMCISIAVFLGVSIYSILSIFRKGDNYKTSKTLLIFSAGLILAIFIVRLGFTVKFQLTSISAEALSGAILNTLQSFSMDGSYNEWLSEVRGAKDIFAENTWFTNAYSIYTSVIYVLAPVTGGAILFEILAGIFPHLKLIMASVWRFRETLYFSELNRNSLALANSIKANTKYWWFPGLRPIMVFTDVYTDKEEEKSSELKLSAKAMGAICLDDDLLHIHIRRGKKKKIFLIDENETNNLQTLTRLEEIYKRISKSDIFLFSSEYTAIRLEKTVNKTLKQKYKGNIDKMPQIYIINSKRNLARNLLSDVPLYEPLVGKVNNYGGFDLRVTIIGAGDLGREMFLSAYWFGQILGCNLKINVISKETEAEFKNRINNINPDILKTMDKSDEILRIYPSDDEPGKPYCEFRYYSGDITQYTHGGDIDNALLNSDYIVVAVGSDSDNISSAEKIHRKIGVSNIEKRDKKNQTVIAYVVFNSDLCRMLNSSQEPEEISETGVYMHAFGSLEEVYGIKNVYMEAYAKAAKDIQDKYDVITQNKVQEEAELKSAGKRSEYEYWANISRAMHLRYKVFSSGLIKTSVFNTWDEKERKNKLNEALNSYKELIKNDKALVRSLAWLEHRRWNSFMRINGFRCPKDFTAYSDKTGSHKHIELKLHPCLVECNEKKPDIFAENADRKEFDCLDMVSLDICYKLSGNKYNYKDADEPGQDSLD